MSWTSWWTSWWIQEVFLRCFLIHPSSSFLQVVGPLCADQAIASWMLQLGWVVCWSRCPTGFHKTSMFLLAWLIFSRFLYRGCLFFVWHDCWGSLGDEKLPSSTCMVANWPGIRHGPSRRISTGWGLHVWCLKTTEFCMAHLPYPFDPWSFLM